MGGDPVEYQQSKDKVLVVVSTTTFVKKPNLFGVYDPGVSIEKILKRRHMTPVGPHY